MTKVALSLRGQSFASKAMRETLASWSARIGLAWLAVLVLVAIFAPFIANSHPLLLSKGGNLSSPAITNLTPGDVTLLGAFIAILISLFWKGSGSIRFKLSAVIILGVGIGSYFLIEPPQLTVYDQYREQERATQFDWVIYAPIPYSPKDYLRDYGETGLRAPLSDEGRVHWMGTESNGADVFSRMIYAARISLGIGFVASGIAIVIGVFMGGLMGYFSGVADMLGMRLVEIFEAVPTLFLLLTFVAFFGRSLYIMMVIIGVTGWTGYARYTRAEFLKLRQQDFVQAAVACGLPLRSILFRHMLPNAFAPVLVNLSFGVASAILAEAYLSFIGLGLVDDPSWGQMLSHAVQSSNFYWWMAAFPGGAIFLTVLSYNLIGESLRDALDPYLKKTAS